MEVIKTKTAKCVIPVSIEAPVDRVFPLACPVQEYKWIPGWKCNLIHCPNDRVEEGTIFSEISSAPFLMGNFRGATTWTAVVHDPECYKVHYRLENKKSSSIYKIEFEDNGQGGTKGKLDLTYNATNKKGNKLVENDLEVKIQVMLSILHAMLQHYCETNKMLSAARLQKMVQAERRLSVRDKVLMGLNQLVVSKMEDKDRSRFMNKFYGSEK